MKHSVRIILCATLFLGMIPSAVGISTVPIEKEAARHIAPEQRLTRQHWLKPQKADAAAVNRTRAQTAKILGLMLMAHRSTR